MNNEFRCDTCDISFPSWISLKEHLLSKEHKDKASMGNVESIMEKFLKRFKEANDESSKV